MSDLINSLKDKHYIIDYLVNHNVEIFECCKSLCKHKKCGQTNIIIKLDGRETMIHEYSDEKFEICFNVLLLLDLMRDVKFLENLIKKEEEIPII